MSHAKSVPAFLPRRDLHSLQFNMKYHVLNMKFVTTKYGKSVVVDLEETGVCRQAQDKKFYVYLPKRWSDFMEEQMTTIQPCFPSLCITSHTLLGNEKISIQLDIDYVSTILLQ